jgi:transcriptional regulator with XRE-family HTH domain
MKIETLSNNIRRIRVSRGLTQENVAIDLGISLTAYGRIEQGKTDVSYSRLQQIADYFKIGVVNFFIDERTMDVMNDSFDYQYKRKGYHQIEEELAEVKADLKMIKTHLFGSHM